ncbi:DEAD/DEAH box helicase [Sulfurimonas sp. HSL1-2]|uniref:DEAD/DEAH box helicase n=1 Tax=Thiomicrolovo zhangzhouensis TaxID=3131933 RepID=UPI0031FA1093
MQTPPIETLDDTAAATASFDDFGLRDEILQSIRYAGFKVPSPIQQQAIPLILEGRDVVGQAHTGTGKTAAFGLPTLSKLSLDRGVEALIIVPTRELANQVSDELFKYGKKLGIHTVTVYGGSSYNRQIGLIERGAQVVIATPGRLKDILERNMLSDFAPSTVILDEADEMLDMGFLDDINTIFDFLPTDRQTLLFSATMPKPIKALAERILVEPAFVSITQEETTNKDIAQQYYVIEENERDDAIIRLLDAEELEKTIVFCRTKREVDRLSNVLSSVGYNAKGLHGDMEQRQRESVIRGLKENAIDILVATDVAARGIHINDVSHVINYHIPFDPESYVHRIGRTGRAGQKGVAITLVTPLEFKELQRIRKIVGTQMAHSYIPTKQQVQSKQMSRLVDEIEKQKIYEEATELFNALCDDMDQTQIAYRLISLLMKNMNVKGPQTIGVPKQRLDKIMEAMERNERGGGGGRRGSGKPRRNGGFNNRRRQDGDRNRGDRNRGGRRS